MDKGMHFPEEFISIALGDTRLNNRFTQVANALFENPQAPIQQACGDWNKAKAAYRLFDNEKLKSEDIRITHQEMTVNRLSQCEEKIILSIQDTTTLNYTHHPKKEGMGKIFKSPGFAHPIKGCLLHNNLLITENGMPLGLIDQKIYQHTPTPKNHKQIPITEKESYRWIESLKKVDALCKSKEIITICDRESDIYEFFVESQKLSATVLVRAAKDRILFASKHCDHTTLWPYMKKQNLAAKLVIEVPPKHNQPKRQATVEVRFAEVILKPPQRSPAARIEKLPDVKLFAVWVSENHPPKDVKPLEWMLLINKTLKNTNEAITVIKWYKLRWSIECYHRVLKSGCKVEDCRLENYDRLQKYLTLKSIIAYRLYMMTLINRTDPNSSCELILSTHEWRALVCLSSKKPPSSTPPTINEAVKMIAKLGGFLGRKSDGDPGPMSIWRGWEKLTNAIQLWLSLGEE